MLQKLKISSDALQVCMSHALSTEKEEIMGLLIGEVEDGVSHVHATIMLYRLDKRKDRVEISPEQLSEASSKAEEIGKMTHNHRPMRIIGWYHSHPHITVWPSHVDVRTQASYQLMDKDFLGLIVSCYNDCNGTSQVQVTCFQSVENPSNPSQFIRREIPQEIVQVRYMSEACIDSLATFPDILLKEEMDAYTPCLNSQNQDMITAIQNASVFSQSLMKIIEYICAPFLQNMEVEKKMVDETNKVLKKRISVLKANNNVSAPPASSITANE